LRSFSVKLGASGRLIVSNAQAKWQSPRETKAPKLSSLRDKARDTPDWGWYNVGRDRFRLAFRTLNQADFEQDDS
jgi:hypothetical protein